MITDGFWDIVFSAGAGVGAGAGFGAEPSTEVSDLEAWDLVSVDGSGLSNVVFNSFGFGFLFFLR